MGGVPMREGYHSVNPYIVVEDAERLIDFLVQVFGAAEQGRSLRPDGRIDHGDVRIGDSLVMLSKRARPTRPAHVSTSSMSRTWTPPTGPRWRPEQPRSWSRPSSRGATVSVALSTRSTTAGGSQPICESSPRPTPFLITRRMLGVDLVGSRRIQPAHVECLVGPDGSRRIQKDRLDDQVIRCGALGPGSVGCPDNGVDIGPRRHSCSPIPAARGPRRWDTDQPESPPSPRRDGQG
jgi:uncharacterized glyoxalase superfamily protein PhnB